ncbi:hypothetical protein DFH28DRAFT_877554 [Melampsora americana]|nr:hypothetical protein DFH28DRAFT_877554 [Melampsora americana]
MAWVIIIISLAHLLIFQTNCFQNKVIVSSGFPTTHIEKYIPRNDQTPTQTTGGFAHHFWNIPSSSTNEKILSEPSHIDLNTVPHYREEMISAEDVSAKRKRRNMWDRKLKSSKFSRESEAGTNLSSRQDRLQIDLNSFPQETTEDVISENLSRGISSSPDVIFPSQNNQWCNPTSKPDRLFEIYPDNRYFIHSIKDPMDEHSSLIRIGPTLEPSDIDTRNKQKKTGLANHCQSNPNMFSKSESFSDSSSKNQDFQQTNQHQSQDPCQFSINSISQTQHSDGPNTYHSNVEVPKENVQLSSSSKSSGRVYKVHPSNIYMDILQFHLNDSPVLNEINHWFHDLQKQMYQNNPCLLEIQSQINYLIGRTKVEITIGFLGCLYIFEHGKPQWKQSAALLEDGWQFLRGLFIEWKNINMEDLGKMNVRKVTGSSYWSPDPWSNAKYILDMDVRQKIPMAMYVELHQLWTRKGSNPIDNMTIQAMHKQFFKLVKEMDPKFLKEKFYKIACVNSQEYKSYVEDILVASTQALPRKEKPRAARLPDKLKITGKIYASKKLRREIDDYFKKMHLEIINISLKHVFDPLYPNAERASSTHAHERFQSIEPDFAGPQKAVRDAHSKVTFGFLGSLVMIYQDMLPRSEIEEVLQSGWEFLKRQFSTWAKNSIRIIQMSETNGSVQMRPIRAKNLGNSLDIFQYLAAHQTPYVPVNCVHALLTWWIDDLSYQKQMGMKINFKIPVHMERTLGASLKDPKQLF